MMNATEIAAITTNPSGKAVAKFLSFLEIKEVDKLLATWAEDAVFKWPFSHKGIPGLKYSKFKGRQRIYELFKKVAIDSLFLKKCKSEQPKPNF
ncbi:hypothetical protein [Microcoleus sp. FACHB-68]|uniref:hypothetical protein n=1 Tax=Microcoleus sp. FACHB-68 TaxID=2692826 RepID=UPI001684A803|nr:hypothetical protein [Microcoleus sp. FACHB-68]MBD1939370.1 hypothetical protein [Microcoleus sp. FACHB-68]